MVVIYVIERGKTVVIRVMPTSNSPLLHDMVDNRRPDR
jgi:hypothetical protein